MKTLFKTILKSLIIILASALAGTVLLLLVDLIPSDAVFNNAKGSASTLKELGTNPTVVHGYAGTQIDTYTDAWMLRIAAYNGPESALDRAMSSYFYGYTDTTGSVVDSTVALFEDVPGYERLSYARYWHGYQVWLRPLLLIFDYADIIELLKMTILALTVAVAVCMYAAGLKNYIPAFVATLVFINYTTVSSCMQYADIIFICLISALYMLRYKQFIIADWQRQMYMFTVIGVITVFLDFLTYPMLSLGFAMVFLLGILTSDSTESQKPFILTKTVISGSVFWAMGYAVMWGLKWVLASILTTSNVIADGIGALTLRTSNDVAGESVSIVDVIKQNVLIYGKWAYITAFLIMIIITLLIILKFRAQHTVCFGSADIIIAYLLCMVMPFAWYMVGSNHSYLHAFMTYRVLGISIFAFFSLCITLSRKLLRTVR